MSKKILSLYQVRITAKSGEKYTLSFDNRAAAFDFQYDAKKHPNVADVEMLNDHGYSLYSTAANAMASLEWMQ